MPTRGKDMNSEIIKYYEMKPLWEKRSFMDENRIIHDVYIQPERLSEKDRKVCDSPNTPTKGSETSRND